MKAFATAILFFLFLNPSFANEKITPVDQFRDNTFIAGSCAHKAKMTLLDNDRILIVKKGKINSDWKPIYDCITVAKKDSQQFYQTALRSLAGKPAAIELLKNYYAAWLSEVDAVAPLHEEQTSQPYRKRQRGVFGKSEAIWSRLKVELM